MGLSLHHIGILVKDINKSASEYSKMGYEIVSKVIHDPTQTAFVQLLKLGEDSVYIELISPDGPSSKLSNQLKKGGGLNHLCYQTPSIEETFDKMRDKGLFGLHAPVEAVAFSGRRIAWLMGRDGIPVELVETDKDEDG